MAQEKASLVIIGAGWHGLATAKTYHQLNPLANLIILDAYPTIGGVWAEHRLYPGLKSNNMLGTYEYSDFPMGPEFGVKPGEHIPGEVVHAYLKAYAKAFGIYECIRFNSRVQTVEGREEGLTMTWTISIAGGASILTEKLVVATGLTTDPFMPQFNGSKKFGAPLFHSASFRQHETLLKSAKRVTVLGGTKSAWDAVYAFMSAGVAVDWVIRHSGHGPVWMAPPYVTPFKKWLEKLTTTRFLTWFSPCIWGEADGFTWPRRFLHGTRLGRWIVSCFWAILASDVVALNGYDKHPETKKLRPWYSPFWLGSGLSIFNYETDFLELVRNGGATVHIADIERLSPRTVHLSSGKVLKTDALVCATGWNHRPTIRFLPEHLDLELRFPESDKFKDYYAPLIQKADQEILTRFPSLKNQPTINRELRPMPGDKGVSKNQPLQLYRFMLHPDYSHRSIAFNGMASTVSTALVAQAQALWICVQFSSPLSLQNQLGRRQCLDENAVLHNRFGKWRYPAGHGARFPDFVFDAIPYIDMLLGDLMMKTRRKESWFKEVFEPYGAADYRGLVEEWQQRWQEQSSLQPTPPMKRGI